MLAWSWFHLTFLSIHFVVSTKRVSASCRLPSSIADWVLRIQVRIVDRRPLLTWRRAASFRCFFLADGELGISLPEAAWLQFGPNIVRQDFGAARLLLTRSLNHLLPQRPGYHLLALPVQGHPSLVPPGEMLPDQALHPLHYPLHRIS